MAEKICPKCGSGDVGVEITVTAAVGVPQNYKCNDCGYTSILFPELDSRDKK